MSSITITRKILNGRTLKVSFISSNQDRLLRYEEKNNKSSQKYSVPDKVLDQFVDLFRSWGIEEKDWIIVTENALQRHGYHIVDYRNVGEIDILIRRQAIPWRVRNGEWTCIPPARSKWLKDLHLFISETHCTLHLLTLPFGPLKVNVVERAAWYQLLSKRKIRVEWPYNIVFSYAEVLIDRKLGPSFYDRIVQWSEEVQCIEMLARKKRDKKVLNACNFFLDIVKGLPTLGSSIKVGTIHGRDIGKQGVIRGVIQLIRKKHEFASFIKGNILVTEDTSVVFIPLLNKVRAIVTDRGGLTSHAATLAREFGIPAVIGTRVATKVLKTGDRVEVDTKRGIVRKLNK